MQARVRDWRRPVTDWFATDGLTPHGFCLAWDPNLIAAIVVANATIAFCYVVIAIVLVSAALAPRPAVPRWLYWSFAAFIFCCGLSHVFEDLTLWFPLYRLQALVLAVTALVSLLAAILPITTWMTREAARWRN